VCVGVLVLLATAGICVLVMWVSAARFERTVVCPGGPGVGDRPAPLVVPAREAVVSVESRS
jgi:hypothetical protein